MFASAKQLHARPWCASVVDGGGHLRQRDIVHVAPVHIFLAPIILLDKVHPATEPSFRLAINL